MSTRADILTTARIGEIEFTAIAATGGGERRIARHGAIGMDGEYMEDLGEAARTDEIRAVLTEAQWLQLDEIRRRGKAVDIVHPLFGSYIGRVVAAKYEGGLRDHVDVTITVVEDAEHRPTRPRALNPSAAASKLAGAASDLEQIPLDYPELQDVSSSQAISAFDDVVASARDIVDLVEAGVTTAADAWHAASAAYETITSGVATVVDDIRNTVADVATDLADPMLEIYDQVHSVVVAARETIDAISDSLADTWRQVTTTTIRPLDQIIRDAVGEVSDDLIDAVLASNPALTDPLMVPAGVTVRIPLL